MFMRCEVYSLMKISSCFVNLSKSFNDLNLEDTPKISFMKVGRSIFASLFLTFIFLVSSKFAKSLSAEATD